jgi:RNA polymerase sigma-70 factor (ECF subfamily)
VLAATEIERVFRQDSGRATATLARLFGHIDMAEEAVQEAFVRAVEKWPIEGVPPSPAGWIITTAKNSAIDRLRRESTRDDRQAEAVRLVDGEPEDVGPVDDDQLRLIFTCCHPSLSSEAQVALTLRLIAGLQTSEIARAFLVPEPTMGQRLFRAKRKIRAANIPYRIPRHAELPSRLRPVLAVVYLVFNEGYVATQGENPVRDDLCAEAIRLARVMRELMPDEPEVMGLLALLLLTESRRQARIGPHGSIVRLADQDRGMWDRELIEEGKALVRACLRRNRPSTYQIQAAIAAVHADATDVSATDWPQIVLLYNQLMAHNPTPVVAMNRAIAVAEIDGPTAALEILEDLDMDRYYLYHASRGDLLERLGRHIEAEAAFQRASDLTVNQAEKDLLETRLRLLRSRRQAGGASAG